MAALIRIALLMALLVCAGCGSSPPPASNSPPPSDEAHKRSDEILADVVAATQGLRTYHLAVQGKYWDQSLRLDAVVDGQRGLLAGTLAWGSVPPSRIVANGTALFTDGHALVEELLGRPIAAPPPGTWTQLPPDMLAFLGTLRQSSLLARCLHDDADTQEPAIETERDGHPIIEISAMSSNDNREVLDISAEGSIHLISWQIAAAGLPPASCSGSRAAQPDPGGGPQGLLGVVAFSDLDHAVAVTPPPSVATPPPYTGPE